MDYNNVAGVHIPDSIIERLAGADDQAQEGVDICVEMIQQIREISGVHGIHLMAYKQEKRVAEIITRAGVLDGRRPWHPGMYDASDAEENRAGLRSQQ